MNDLLVAIIKHFSVFLTVQTYKQILVEDGVFQRGSVTLSANFRWKGHRPPNVFGIKKTRVIALSCVIKISAVYSFVSSQSTRVTERRADRRTDRQNYDF